MADKPKRRLKNIKVDKVALVDKPAVPEATFVIAKRETKKAGGVKEAFVDALDSLRKVAGEMDEGQLYVLAELMRFTKFAFQNDSEMMKSLDEMRTEIGGERLDAAVVKATETAETETEEETVEIPPIEPAEKPPTEEIQAEEVAETPDLLNRLAEILLPPPPNQDDVLAAIEGRLNAAIQAVETVGHQVATITEQSAKLHETVHTATGRVA